MTPRSRVTGRRSVAVVLCAAALLPATGSFAETRGGAGVQSARAQAARLSAAGLYEGAADAYRLAFTSSGSANDLVHVAELQLKLGRADLAAETYEQALAAHDPHFHDATSITRRLKKLDTSVGRIDVHASEPDAELHVRDRASQHLPLPRPIRLLPGRRRVVVAKEGFEEVGIDVEVQAGETRTLEAKLVPLATVGHVVVSEKNGAPVHVFVDDADRGAAPQDLELPVGDHAIDVRGTDLHSAAAVAHVDRHKRAKLELEAHSTLGTVALHISPADAAVLVDGAAYTVTSNALSMSEGEHAVDLTAPGFSAKHATVHVAAGETTELTVALTRSGPTPEQVEAEHRRREAAEREGFVGGYGSFVLFQTNALTETSIACSTATCEESADLGGGLRIAGGYSFGVLGLEASLLAAASRRAHVVRHAASTSLGAYDESIWTVAGHAIAAAGPRLRTTTHGVQLTGSLQAGVAFADFGTRRNVSNGYTDSTNDNETTYAPAAEADLAISFGSRPGPSFTLGVLAFGDLPGHLETGRLNRSVTPDAGGQAVNMTVPAYRLTTGPEVFVGPMLGVSFGH